MGEFHVLCLYSMQCACLVLRIPDCYNISTKHAETYGGDYGGS